MAGETTLTVVGNLTDDPELKYTPSGAPVVNFTVASTPRTFDRQSNEWKDGEAMFFRCAAWRQMAENIAGSLQKGQRVIVTGQLRIRNFERQDGSRGTSVEINVDEIGPSLRFATAQTQRASRPEGGGYGGGQSRPAADPWASSQPSAPSGPDAWGGSNEDPPF